MGTQTLNYEYNAKYFLNKSIKLVRVKILRNKFSTTNFYEGV